MIDVIYPLHNRLYYTQMTFPRLVHECTIYKDCRLWIYDDNSTDGSSEFVRDVLSMNRVDYHYEKNEIGNSTYCINQTLKNGNAEWMYKVDNDILIPVGSFEFMINKMPADAGFMMMGETGDFPKLGTKVINRNRSHIGGVGLFRRKAFDKPIRTERRFFGFTQYQIESKKRGWKCAEVDATNTNLDMSPFWSMCYDYEAKGWGRVLNNVDSVLCQE